MQRFGKKLYGFLGYARLFLEGQVFKYTWSVCEYHVQYLVFKLYLNIVILTAAFGEVIVREFTFYEF